MNKTIIININGFVFHIEEDAYEILKAYMTDVKRHFLNSADSLEITTDIENRIAEMFTDILAADNKQVIVEQDVKEVVEQMGTVDEFEYEEGEAAAHDNYSYNTGTRTLFRDSEDHLLGGVCAGLANYFGTQPVWIRLAFAIAFCFAGTGLILYIILWIVIPKAVTRADRMAMKGQKPDLHGFKKSFEEEVNSVRSSLSDLSQQAKPFAYKARDFTGDFFHHLGIFFGQAGKLFVKFLGIVALIACFGTLIALIVAIIATLAFGKVGIFHIFPFSILEYRINTIFFISSFLVIALPVCAIIITLISTLFNTHGLGRTVGSTFLIIWLFTVGTVIYYSAKASANFSHGASFSQTVDIKPTGNNTYYLKLNDIKYLSGEDSIRLKIKEQFNNKVILDNDDSNDDDDNFDIPDNVTIEIERSEVKQPTLVESFSARGRSYENALLNARTTSYQFLQQDSVLKFSRHLEKPLNHLWRNQEVHLVLKVPENAKVVIDHELNRFLRDIDYYDCRNRNKLNHDVPVTFIMGTDGLTCKVDTSLSAAKANVEANIQ